MEDPGHSETVTPAESKSPRFIMVGTKIVVAISLAAAFMVMGTSCALMLGSLGPFKMPLAGIAFILSALAFHILLRPRRPSADKNAELAALVKAGAGGILIMGTLGAGITGFLFFLMSQGNTTFTTMGGICLGLFALQLFLLFIIYRADLGAKSK